MRIDKRQIVDFFMVRGEITLAEQADEELPDPVNLTEHAALLRALGIDPGLLATQMDNLEA